MLGRHPRPGRDSVHVNPVPSEAAASPVAYAADHPLTGTC